MNEKERQQRLYVAKMAEKLRAGKITRRQFIRAAALAGFGFSSAWYLGGCAPARPTPAQPTQPEAPKVDATTGSGSLTPEQQFLKEVGGRFRGTRVKIVSENTSPGLVISRLVKEEFTPLTGIEIDWEIVPLDQVLAKTIQDTVVGATGGKGQSDVYYWDQSLAGSLRERCHTNRRAAGEERSRLSRL